MLTQSSRVSGMFGRSGTPFRSEHAVGSIQIGLPVLSWPDKPPA